MVKIIYPTTLLIISAFFLIPIKQASSFTISPKIQYGTEHEIAAKNNSLKLNNASKLSQVATLANANISFHTNNEDKDADTHVTILVKDRYNRVAARLSNDLGHFDDNSDAGPYALKIRNASDIESIQQGSVTVRVDPNGHDTWRFNFSLDLQFSDGSHLSAEADGLELSHNRRQQTFGTDGIVKR